MKKILNQNIPKANLFPFYTKINPCKKIEPITKIIPVNIIKKDFTMTNTQQMEKLKNVSVYKRIIPKLGIPFSARKSQELLKASINEGCANSYFSLADQFQTQSDPTFCGPTTMASVFNSLNVDPKRKWKGIWRWYLEEIIKCLDVSKVKDFGMTLEEFAIIAKCNGVFSEVYRPDEDEAKTELEMLKIISENKIKNKNISAILDLPDHPLPEYENKHNVIHHDTTNSECKKNFTLVVKKANEDFFRTCVYASTKRENFFLVTNTSRKALKQTGDGHFSPVAAYNHSSDHLLLFDSARFKYNSMWFTIPMIFNAFVNIDKATQKMRGFILCSRYY
jgi:glutathione gamma-glutamylcysteinyltransferase